VPDNILDRRLDPSNILSGVPSSWSSEAGALQNWLAYQRQSSIAEGLTDSVPHPIGCVALRR